MQASINRDAKGKFTGIDYDGEQEGSLVEQGKAMEIKDKLAVLAHVMALKAKEVKEDPAKAPVDAVAVRTEIKELKKQIAGAAMTTSDVFIASIPSDSLRQELLANRDNLQSIIKAKEEKLASLEASLGKKTEEKVEKQPTNDDLLAFGVLTDMMRYITKPKTHREPKKEGEKASTGDNFKQFVKDKIAEGKSLLFKGIDSREWEYTPELAKTMKLSQAMQHKDFGGYGSPRKAEDQFIKVIGEETLAEEAEPEAVAAE